MPLPDGSGFDALIFDWDGTLVDSQPVNYRALAAALALHGVTMSAAWYWQRLGTSGAELIAELGRTQEPPVDLPVDEIVRVCLGLIRQNLHEITVNTAVVQVARLAHGRRPLGVASGGSREVVLPEIELTGLSDLFDVVVVGEDAPRGKPDPGLFLLCAQRLGVDPRRCLVFEDAPEGLEAAHRAGMTAVDVRPFLRVASA